jgi:hypothetical protein
MEEIRRNEGAHGSCLLEALKRGEGRCEVRLCEVREQLDDGNLNRATRIAQDFTLR